VGGTCGTHVRGKCIGLRCESPKKTAYSEDLGVDGRMGSECILGRLAEGECGVDPVGSE
jgi:hypothetical protein